MAGNTEAESMSAAEIAAYAQIHGISIMEAMQKLLAAGIWPKRFCRNRGLLSREAQMRLLSLRIFVAGCGGLGGHICDFLARLGAGCLWICDQDVFEESNLNRQLYCAENTLGRPKAAVVREKLLEIAPYMQIKALELSLNQTNLPELLQGKDLAIDCLDSVRDKTMLEAAAARAGIAYLHGSVLEHEGFAFLDWPGLSRLASLYPGETSAGSGNILAPVVSCTAAVMCSLLAAHLMRGVPNSRLVHVDCSVPEMENFETS